MRIIPTILIGIPLGFLKSIHLIQQTATWPTFDAPIPAVSHLVVFGFISKKSEYNLNFSER